MRIITLPVSGHVVELRESITWNEFQAIDKFFLNRMKIKIVDEQKSTEVEGALDAEMEAKMIQTFLQSCKGKDGQTISTVGLMNTLDMEDGLLIKDTVAEIYEVLKKKATKTTKE